VFVANFAELGALRASGLLSDERLRERFPSAFRFSCPGYTNAIVALCRDPVREREFLDRLALAPTLRPAATRRLLTFRTHALRSPEM
jgi:hypothetical protein